MKYFLIIIIIIASFAGGFFCRSLSDSQGPRVVYDTIPGDSVFTEVIKKEFYPVKEDTTIYDTIIKIDTFLRDVDTAAILRDYYAYRIYKDTLKNDSSATIVVEDSISRNRKLKSKLIFSNNRPIAYNVTNEGVFLGGSISTISIGFDAEYLKGENSFGIGLNFVNTDNNFKLVPELTYKRKLNTKQWDIRKLWMK